MMALRNDIELQAKLLSVARGSNETQVLDWLIERSTGSGNKFFVIADAETSLPIGYLQFVGIDTVNRNADLGICLAPDAQGKRFGRQALELALRTLRDSGDVRKISLRVRTDNEIAIKCYQNIGFRQCGLLSKHVFIDDDWRDVILMELFLWRDYEA